MGLEATCIARHQRRVSKGIAQLETIELRFRGTFRFAIPYAKMKSVIARAGVLEIATTDGITELELGSKAETWRLKIRYPKPVIDKLGVKPGHVVSVLGVDDS